MDAITSRNRNHVKRDAVLYKLEEFHSQASDVIRRRLLRAIKILRDWQRNGPPFLT